MLQAQLSLVAQEEVVRLQAESDAKREQLASLEASMGAQAAAMEEMARQRDDEAARRLQSTIALQFAGPTTR